MFAIVDAAGKDLVIVVQTICLAALTVIGFSVAIVGTQLLKRILETGEKSHDLGNSLMLETKRRLAVISMARAELSGSVEDMREAQIDQRAYESHRETAERMDRKGTRKPETLQ